MLGILLTLVPTVSSLPAGTFLMATTPAEVRRQLALSSSRFMWELSLRGRQERTLQPTGAVTVFIVVGTSSRIVVTRTSSCTPMTVSVNPPTYPSLPHCLEEK